MVKPILNHIYPLYEAKKAFEESLTERYFRIALKP
jgi:hypothetical protein